MSLPTVNLPNTLREPISNVLSESEEFRVVIMEELKREINELGAEAKWKVFKHFDWLMMQILYSSGLEQPYYIFIDNCILQDAKSNKSNEFRGYRFLATCLFFRFLRDRAGVEAKLAIPASILYEFSGKSGFSTEDEYISTLELLLRCLEPLGLEAVSIGFSDFQDAKKSISAIRLDEKKITRFIGRIKKKEWDVELRKGSVTKFPMGIAYRALPSNIKLKYFNEDYVRWVFASIIETEILRNRANDKRVRKTFRNNFVFSLSSLNKIKKGVLEGLGDLELLSYCDVTSQFQNENEFTCVAVTFDENLFKTLFYRQGLVVTHEPFVVGVDSDEDRLRKFKQMDEGQKRLDLTHEREDIFRNESANFYAEIREIFT